MTSTTVCLDGELTIHAAAAACETLRAALAAAAGDVVLDLSQVQAFDSAGAQFFIVLVDQPTLAETLSPGYEAVGWTGLVAPAATPAEVVRKVNADVAAVLREPAVVERMAGMATLADPTTPEGFAAFVRDEIAKWREVARAANVRLDG